jgi:hypothetical protein
LSAPNVDVRVAEPACPHCGEALAATGTEVVTVTDLPAGMRPRATADRVQVCRRHSSGRAVRGTHLSVAADQIGATANRLGPRIEASATPCTTCTGRRCAMGCEGL